MSLEIETETQRIINTITGEYMTWHTANRETHELTFVIHASDGKGLLAATLQIQNTGPGNGIATLTRAVLRKAWVPTGLPEPPRNFVANHEKLDELPRYLERWNDFGGIKQPHPAFTFIDGR